ncbi:glycosyl hydrolase family 95 catalytic domain-containing protein [Aerococcus urinae]|uniref:glycoside hydrolase family 95 protein n=1 Tax=Aerococcus urinae TaxID=1376 RepID=UPI000DCCAD2F|nr:hypothetical protein DBT41_06440 [Aerococcus urinae]
MNDELLYDTPPNSWNEALPIGNGTLGAMIFGNVGKERIQLNEDSLWSGGFRERGNSLSSDSYKDIRELLQKKQFVEAERKIKETMWSYFLHSTHYQTAGDVWLDFDMYRTPYEILMEKDEVGIPRSIEKGEKAKDYIRKINIKEGVWHSSYIYGGHRISKEAFVSKNKNIIFYKIKGDDLSFMISYTRKDNGRAKVASYIDKVYTDGNNYIFGEGHNGSSQEGIDYCVGIRVDSKGGIRESNGSSIFIKNAQEVLISITIRTSFRNTNPKEYCKKVLLSNKYSYQLIKTRHVENFVEQTSRFSLEFSDSSKEANEMIKYLNYGRYLLISSSYKDSLPANLQGIWNPYIWPAWGSGYTLNVNLEMNYSFALNMGLIECYIPLLEHILRMLPHGMNVAKDMYDLSGFVAHHSTDLWGDCMVGGNNLMASLWPMGGAWLSLSVLKVYEYTRDISLLERYFPILEESAKFLNYYLFDDNGRWSTGPSLSPENQFIYEGRVHSACNGPSMDIQITYEVFTSYIKACQILNIENDLLEKIKEKMSDLKPVEISEDGRIKEWNEEYIELDKGHRHLSHLYCMHPGRLISINDKKEVEAVHKSLLERLKNGGGHTSWSAAWIANLFNRLGKPEKATEFIFKIISTSSTNYFSQHPPFQIDGNFGATEAILNFIIQEENNKLLILPSIPKFLESGEMKGYHSKFGCVINIKWSRGDLDFLEIKPINQIKDVIVNIEIFKNNKPFKEKKLSISKNEVLKMRKEEL